MIDKDCIFCKIVAGDIPSHKVYEDEKYLSFLDIDQSPKGKLLVIPKEHFRWIYDTPYFGEYFETVQKVGLGLKAALGAKWFNLFSWGTDVPHAHIHIYPRYSLKESPGQDKKWKYSDEEMRDLVEKIKQKINK